MNFSFVMNINANKIVIRNKARFSETYKVLLLRHDGLGPLARSHFRINLKTTNLIDS
jgi:hypothetical protein